MKNNSRMKKAGTDTAESRVPRSVACFFLVVLMLCTTFAGCLEDEETTPPPPGTPLHAWDMAAGSQMYGILKRTIGETVDFNAPKYNATVNITSVGQNNIQLDWVNHYPRYDNETNMTVTESDNGTVAVNGFGTAHAFTPPWYFNDTFSETPSSMLWLSKEVFSEVMDHTGDRNSSFDFDFWGEPALWIVKEIIEALGFDVEFNITFVRDITYKVRHNDKVVYMDAVQLTDPLNNYYIVMNNSNNPLVMEFHYGFNNWTAWEIQHTDPGVNILTLWNLWTTGLGYKILDLRGGTLREVGTYGEE
jgi:hypothetical protein